MSIMPSVNAHFDLLIVGSGPAAQKCAVDSAKRGKRVAVVDKHAMHGGVCVHTGTIPSKTFREAILHLTGYRHQGFYGKAYLRRIGVKEIMDRVLKVETGETDVVRDQLNRNNITIITGTARFLDNDPVTGKTRVAVLRTMEDAPFEATSASRHFATGTPKAVISADKFLVACGTRPLRRSGIPFDGIRVFDSDQLLWGGVKEVPKNMIVMGAGVIGMEYASMMNIIPGSQVTVIDKRNDILSFADKEVTEALLFSMRARGARFLLGETVTRVEVIDDRVVCHLASGKKVGGDGLLYCMGRQGNTDTLGLECVGVNPDDRGLLQVNDFYQTTAPHIYAAGDCIGYPALASTSMEQGRRASCHMWDGEEGLGHVHHLQDHGVSGEDGADGITGGGPIIPSDPDASKVKSVMSGGFLGRSSEQMFPYGIYTIPEISMIGKTEQQLTAEKVSYEVGEAQFSEVAKGQMLGGTDGFLKLLFCPTTLKLLGVHAFGEGATEIVHIGQVVMALGGTIEYFKNAVFNYPTFAEAYTLAAHDGLRKTGNL